MTKQGITLENITIQQLDWEHAQLKRQAKVAIFHGTLKSWIADLSDDDFGVYMAGQTWSFGRPFVQAVDNAKCHMQNRAHAEQLFSR